LLQELLHLQNIWNRQKNVRGESDAPKIKSYFVQPRSNLCAVQAFEGTSSLQYVAHHNSYKLTALQQWELFSDSEKHSPKMLKFPQENRSNY
jgi:hypothetical protein